MEYTLDCLEAFGILILGSLPYFVSIAGIIWIFSKVCPKQYNQLCKSINKCLFDEESA